MLDPYRVLDLTDDRGEIAGMVLGDLGADVIRVEPPEGSPARRRRPMLVSGEESLRSLQFQAYNRNKRSIALDLSAAGDRATFLELVARSDVVLESGQPGELERAGLGFERLREANPRLVYVRITPFGSDGPYAAYAATDLTLAAMGGPLILQGPPARAPVRVSVPQVWRHTGVEAAVAAQVGLARARRTGRAQFLDVSAQCVMTWTMLEAMDAYAIQGFDFERTGPLRDAGPARVPILYSAADGDVIFAPLASDLPGAVAWMVADGTVPAEWGRDEVWSDYLTRLRQGEPITHAPADVVAALQRFFARRSREALLERGLADGVTVVPVNTLADLTRFGHLGERDYWRDVQLADGRSVPAPGGFFRLAGQRIEAGRPAPALNAHAEDIRNELAQEAPPRVVAGAAEGDGTSSDLPFAGVKVADFSWVGVGPITAKYLADHGASVVHVESELRPDVLRGRPPFKDAEPGLNRSQFFGDFNTSKRGLALDLKTPEGVAVAKRLIAWADVCIESFGAGKFEALGLEPAAVRELNPSLIMVDTCLMGQTGPAAGLTGFGFHAAAVAGFHDLTGWPDLPPSGPWTAYTDTIAPRFLAATVMAALDHKRRTGEGQMIDAAQLEMALHFLAPEILDYHATGHVPQRLGNRSPGSVPHGVYPCAGEDRWCAIAVETDAQWLALRAALGDPAWASDPALGTAAGRVEREQAIDEVLSDWTRERRDRAVMETLQAAGVPAGMAMRSSDLLADPQYAHRGFYRYLDHPEMGRIPYAGHQFRIAGYDNGPWDPAPLLGEHSFEILRDDLALSESEMAELAAAGALR